MPHRPRPRAKATRVLFAGTVLAVSAALAVGVVVAATQRGARAARVLRPTGGAVATPEPDPGADPPPVALAGCPAPPAPPGTRPPAPPSHPAVLVPDAALPAPTPPAPRVTDLRALSGKGMWIWQWKNTEGGDAAAVVAKAEAAGLHQLWVRVGDSFDGFYGSAELDALVPRAHRAGIAVLGWGFPYLYDPVGDAAWTRAALDWRGPGGVALDGFGADIEEPSEGVDLSARRAVLYLASARPAAAGRPLVGTVYPPTDRLWASYPYAAMSSYVDAFAPMVYWACDQPAADVTEAVDRLATLAPVHPIGQAYSTAGTPGQRTAAPSGAEVERFLAAARADGAVGASLWSWQAADSEEWSAAAAFAWAGVAPVGGQPKQRVTNSSKPD